MLNELKQVSSGGSRTAREAFHLKCGGAVTGAGGCPAAQLKRRQSARPYRPAGRAGHQAANMEVQRLVSELRLRSEKPRSITHSQPCTAAAWLCSDHIRCCRTPASAISHTALDLTRRHTEPAPLRKRWHCSSGQHGLIAEQAWPLARQGWQEPPRPESRGLHTRRRQQSAERAQMACCLRHVCMGRVVCKQVCLVGAREHACQGLLTGETKHSQRVPMAWAVYRSCGGQGRAGA